MRIWQSLLMQDHLILLVVKDKVVLVSGLEVVRLAPVGDATFCNAHFDEFVWPYLSLDEIPYVLEFL